MIMPILTASQISLFIATLAISLAVSWVMYHKWSKLVGCIFIMTTGLWLTTAETYVEAGRDIVYPLGYILIAAALMLAIKDWFSGKGRVM